MRTEKDVAGELVKDGKAALVVRGNLRIGPVADEFVTGIDVWAADDDDVQKAAILGFVQRPGGGSFGVAGGEMRGEYRATERNCAAVVKNAINVRGRIVVSFLRPYWKSALPPDSTTGTSPSMT